MSYTNGTTHYNLPLTTGADKRDWSDTNQAFNDIDAALYGAVQDTAQAELDIDALETRMDTAEQNISTNTGNIAGLDTRVTTVEGAITSLSGQVTDTRQDLEDMICAYNEASATSTHAYAIGDYFIYNDVLYKATQAIAIGDTIVPDTNCATTNVTTELLATEDLSGDVQQLQTDVGQLQTDVETIESGARVLTTLAASTNLETTLKAVLDYLDTLSDIKIMNAFSIIDGRLFNVAMIDSAHIGMSCTNTRVGSNTLSIFVIEYDRTTHSVTRSGDYETVAGAYTTHTALTSISVTDVDIKVYSH